MKNVLKNIQIFILICMLLCSPTASVYADELNNNFSEDQIELCNIDDLSDDEFDMNSVIVILKKEYSGPDSKINKNIFRCVEKKKVDNLSTSEASNKDQFRNIIHVELKKNGRKEVKKAIEKLSKRKEIYYVGPDLKWEAQIESVPNDPEIQSEDVLKSYRNMQLPEAWDITVGSKDVLAANNEAIQYTHEDIKDNMWINPNPTTSELHGYNFNSSTGSVYANDGNGHGTLTAGIIGAVGNNGIGTSGVAQKVSIMSVMASGSSQFAQAMNFLNDLDVNLLNISLLWGKTLDQSIKQSFINFNGLVTISAGNDGLNLDTSPRYPASYSTICGNVIAVAAVDENDNLTDYSNYGVNTVALAAPALYKSLGLNNTYYIGAGTSSAAPVVLGTAALIKSVAPNYEWYQVKAAILNNVDVLPGLSGKVSTGGRINAYKALKAVTAESGTYYIRNANSNLYLDAEASAYTDLIQHAFMGGNNQRFTLENNSLKCVQNNKYLTTGSSVKPNFQKAVLGAKSNVYLSKNIDGTYYILKKDGSSLKALDVNNASTSTESIGWSSLTGSASQKWVLEDGNKSKFEQGTYYIINKNSGRYLDLAEDTGSLIQHGYNNGNNQKWELIPQSNGTYLIKTKSQKYPGYINFNISNSKYYGIVKNTSMQIEIFKNDNDTYKLHWPNYAFCLSVENASTENYTKTLWTSYNSSENEQWYIRKVS